MPTFASIGLDPKLRNRFVVETTTPKTTTTTATTTSNNNIVTCSSKSSSNDYYSTIDTPQGLLSRNPDSIRLLLLDDNNSIKKSNNGNHTDNKNNDNDNDEKDGDDSSSRKRQRILPGDDKNRQQQEQEQEQEQQQVVVHNIPKSKVNELRQEISNELFYQSRQGKRLSTLRQQQHNDNDHSASSSSFRLDSAASLWDEVYISCPGSSNGSGSNSSSTPTPSSLFFSSGAQSSILSTVSTGCHSLDQLVAFPKPITTTILSAFLSSSSSSSSLAEEEAATVTGTGIPYGYIVQLSGPPASGKTQLALQIACHHHTTTLPAYDSCSSGPEIMTVPNSTLYLASCAGGSSSTTTIAKRFYQLLKTKVNGNHTTNSTRNNTKNNKSNNYNVSSILDHITFKTIKNGYELLTSLAQLEQTLLLQQKQQQQNQEQPTQQQQPPSQLTTKQNKPGKQLVVIDSVSGCLNSFHGYYDDSNNNHMNHTNNNDHNLLQTVAFELKRLARNYSVAFLILNGTVKGKATSSFPCLGHNNKNMILKPALGSMWNKNASDIQLWLQPLFHDNNNNNNNTSSRSNNVVQATLQKHPFKTIDHDYKNSTLLILTSIGILEDHRGA